MGDLLHFPNKQLLPYEVLADVAERVEQGKVKHLMCIVVEEDTATFVAMTSIPAFMAVYMAWYAEQQVRKLMQENGMNV